ncbi:MAG: hypothetical protein RIQ93_1061 [Verrucomicrobiota bacterium]|jgi:uncharacterized protein YgbK (DUF1537 family)
MSGYFLADDLSGALDAAAAFQQVGRRVTVALSAEAWPSAHPEEVIGLTTETRNAPPEVAARAVRNAIAQGQAAGGRLLYKKIDSTLRGPVAAELAALAAAMPNTRILFLPANPNAGRTVRDGILLVNGRPVAETEFGRDPLSPVRESSVARLLAGALTPNVVLANASSSEDLSAAVRQMEAGGDDWVAVGSGALARPVAAARLPSVRPANLTRPEIPATPVLLIGGSAHAVNREQCQRLAQECGAPIYELQPADPAPAIDGAIASANTHGVAMLLLNAAPSDSRVALRAISSAAARVIAAAGVRRIFATGGETAFALCRLLGISHLRFVRELEPGLSLAESSAGGGAILLAVKPGGFGHVNTWLHAHDELRRAR